MPYDPTIPDTRPRDPASSAEAWQNYMSTQLVLVRGNLYLRSGSSNTLYETPAYSQNQYYLADNEAIVFMGDVENGYGKFLLVKRQKVAWALLVALPAEEPRPQIRGLKPYSIPETK